jgi:hypothetical protein
MSRPHLSSSPIRIALLLVGALYVTTLAALEREGLWIVDNANKLLQLQAIAGSGYSDFSIPWPGAAIDPRFEYNPLPHPFSHVVGGRLFSQYPPLFATLSTAPFHAFGPTGLYLLPLCGGLLALAGTARLGRAVGLEPRAIALLVLLTGLGTPLWFYSVVFWEHTLVVALFVWAVTLALRYVGGAGEADWVAATALAAMAVGFRDESLLFWLLLVVIVTVATPGRRLRGLTVAGGTLAAVLLPLGLFHWKALGSPLGFHVAGNLSTAAEHLTSRPLALYRLLVAWGPGIVPSLLIAAPFVALLAINPRLSRRAFRVAVPLLAAVAIAGSLVFLVGLLAERGPIRQLLAGNSLFPAAPVLVLGLVRPRGAGEVREERTAHALWLLAAGYALLYALAAPHVATQGIHWGNRYLLVCYPLFAVLALRNVVAWWRLERAAPAWRFPVILALVLAVVAQLGSLELLRRKKELSVEINRAAAATEGALVTEVWWAPQALFSEFPERPIFLVRSPEQLERLRATLRDEGHETMTLVTRRLLPGPAVVVRDVDDHGLDFFSLRFVTVEP